MTNSKETIVAEISRTYPGSNMPLIGEMFEHVIEVNEGRGYKLGSWRFSQVVLPSPEGDSITETIIAVFKWDYKRDNNIEGRT